MKSYKIEVRSAFAEWDRYSIYLTAVCLGAAESSDAAASGSGGETGSSGGTSGSKIIDYINLTDKRGTLQTPECERVELYFYVIADTFPASDVIAKSPPFEVELVVSGGLKKVFRYDVNQWGGLSVKLVLEN